MKLLVVDDDRVLADVISFTLRKEGYQVLLAHDGEAAIRRWEIESPDLIVLDVNLPKVDGFSVLQQIRAVTDTPVILLTVRREEDDIVYGLELGADDYISKPFSPRQLVARIQAVLRRTGKQSLEPIREFDDLVLRVQWRVSTDGNSGVFVRSKRQGSPWITGHEVQISNALRDDAHCTGSLYGSVAVKPRPDESPNRWHTFEIRCVGKRISVLADGVKVVDADGDKVAALKNKALAGYIGLQDSHAGKGCWIEYRNVRIKELRPAARGGRSTR